MNFPLTRVSAILVTPIIEVFCLRHMFYWRFGHNNFAIGNYGRDVLLPIFCAGALVWHFAPELSEGNLVLWRKCAEWHFASFFLLLLLLAIHPTLRLSLGDNLLVALELSLLALSQMSAWILFLPLSLQNNWRLQTTRLAHLSVGHFLLVMYPRLVEFAWHPLSYLAAAGSHFCLLALGVPNRFQTGYAIQLINSGLVLSINASCSGWEGIFYFLFLFFLAGAIFPNRATKRRTALFLLGGLGLLATLNILRIVLIFALALQLEHFVQAREVVSWVSWAFHANVGWLLYLAGLIVLWRWYCRLILKVEPVESAT